MTAAQWFYVAESLAGLVVLGLAWRLYAERDPMRRTGR